jgi:hypothetical protein
VKKKYPPCCILAFCLGISANGVVLRNGNSEDAYAPCFYCQKYSISDKTHLKLLNDGVCPLPDSDFDDEGNYIASGALCSCCHGTVRV